MTQITELNVEHYSILLSDGKKGLEVATQIVNTFPDVTSAEIDAKAKALSDKLKLSVSAREDQRKPFTRKLDEIKKAFTEVENGFKELDRKIQSKRDAFATLQAAEQRAKEAELQKKVQAEKDRIQKQHDTEHTMDVSYAKVLDSVRQYAGTLIHSLSKKNMDDVRAKLSVNPIWAEMHTKQVIGNMPSQPDYVKEKLKDFIASFPIDAKKILEESLEIMPLALQNKVEAEKLIEEQKVLAEAEQKKKAEENEARAQAQKVLSQMDMAEPVEPATKFKETVEIKVTNNSGWLQIIAFWYEKDPESKSKDLSKKTFAQCKLFAERLANSTGEVIDHAAIQYVAKIKAK